MYSHSLTRFSRVNRTLDRVSSTVVLARHSKAVRGHDRESTSGGLEEVNLVVSCVLIPYYGVYIIYAVRRQVAGAFNSGKLSSARLTEDNCR